MSKRQYKIVKYVDGLGKYYYSVFFKDFLFWHRFLSLDLLREKYDKYYSREEALDLIRFDENERAARKIGRLKRKKKKVNSEIFKHYECNERVDCKRR